MNGSSITGAASEVSRAFITAMPPAFLMLCLINVFFLWLVMSFLEHQVDQRMAVVSKFMDRCTMQPKD